jgi:cobalamin biosynthesis protein CobW
MERGSALARHDEEPLLQSKIPVTIVTGFLGAGKTSLITHLAGHAGGRRLAFLINEFGELGIDREVLLGCGIEGCTAEDVLELTNGCICCTVADDFLPTMRRLLDRGLPPQHIVVETSGLALPKPLVKAFGWPDVRTRATVDGVLAVVDAEAVLAGRFAPDRDALDRQRAADPSLDHESPLEELFGEQVACADMILLNKADRVTAADRPAVEATVRRHARPGVGIVWSRHGRLDPALALGLGLAAEDDLESRRSPHEAEDGEHDHDDFESFVLEVPEAADRALIEARLQRLAAAAGVLRLKGFLAVAGKPARLVAQGVGDRVDTYFDRPWPADATRAGRLVVIGRRGLDRARIEAALAT